MKRFGIILILLAALGMSSCKVRYALATNDNRFNRSIIGRSSSILLKTSYVIPHGA